jgi:hypothetical protein
VLAPGWRRACLVAHIAASVGWVGAVVASLAVAVVALGSPDPPTVRAAYLLLEPLGWYTLVPFSVASLATGLVQSWASRWGLLRHYWVVVKLVMNVLATGVLLLYTQTLAQLADAARATTDATASGLRTPSPVVHAAAAVVLLLVALVLSVYKPRGETGRGSVTAA